MRAKLENLPIMQLLLQLGFDFSFWIACALIAVWVPAIAWIYFKPLGELFEKREEFLTQGQKLADHLSEKADLEEARYQKNWNLDQKKIQKNYELEILKLQEIQDQRILQLRVEMQKKIRQLEHELQEESKHLHLEWKVKLPQFVKYLVDRFSL